MPRSLTTVPGDGRHDGGSVAAESGLFLGGVCFQRNPREQHGLSDSAITRMTDAGVLRQVLRGVYVDARRPDDQSLRAEALALVCPRQAVVARSSAAWLFGVDSRSPAESGRVPLAECIVPPTKVPMRYAGVRCFQARLTGGVVSVHGLRCTDPHRTAVDAMRYLQPHMGLGVADALAHLGLTTSERLVEEVERWRGGRNIQHARRLAVLVEAATQSMGESWTRLRVVDAGFPRPAVQVPVLVDGVVTYYLDFAFPEWRVGLEYDGEEFHSSRQAREHDRVRRLRIERTTGWHVLAVTRAEILGRSLAFERGLGELLGMEPALRRRLW